MIHIDVFDLPDEPLDVVPLTGYPDTVVIRIGEHMSVCVRAVDVDRLTVALQLARALLSGSHTNEVHANEVKENV